MPTTEKLNLPPSYNIHIRVEGPTLRATLPVAKKIWEFISEIAEAEDYQAPEPSGYTDGRIYLSLYNRMSARPRQPKNSPRKDFIAPQKILESFNSINDEVSLSREERTIVNIEGPGKDFHYASILGDLISKNLASLKGCSVTLEDIGRELNRNGNTNRDIRLVVAKQTDAT